MNKTTYKITKMDCAAEESVIRMKLIPGRVSPPNFEAYQDTAGEAKSKVAYLRLMVVRNTIDNIEGT